MQRGVSTGAHRLDIAPHVSIGLQRGPKHLSCMPKPKHEHSLTIQVYIVIIAVGRAVLSAAPRAEHMALRPHPSPSCAAIATATDAPWGSVGSTAGSGAPCDTSSLARSCLGRPKMESLVVDL